MRLQRNPTPSIKILHNLHGQLSGFQILISFLKTSKVSMFYSFSGSITHIFGPKNDILSVP